MRQPERMGETLARLAAHGTVTVTRLAEDFDVSPATVRRDLDLLAHQHLAERSHGGAVARAGLYELPLRYKSVRFQQAKQRIAIEAVRSVVSGMVIGLTGGTTTTEIGRMLPNLPSLTVVTNALNIAAELAVRSDLKLIVTGGTCRTESYELVGPLAEQTLTDLSLDLCFVGVDGISADRGLTTHHEVEAHTNRIMLSRAQRVTVVTDSSKVGRQAFARICPLESVEDVVTDAGAGADDVEELRRAGVDVRVLDVPLEAAGGLEQGEGAGELTLYQESGAG